MPRSYTVVFEAQTIASASGDYDFFELAAAADKPIEIKGLLLSNYSEIKEAEEEMVQYSIVRGHATTGNGTSATPRPLDPGAAAASFTAETVASTPASAGTAVTLLSDTFNIRAGVPLFFPEGFRFRTTNAAGLLVVRLVTGLTDNATMSGTLWVDELV